MHRTEGDTVTLRGRYGSLVKTQLELVLRNWHILEEEWTARSSALEALRLGGRRWQDVPSTVAGSAGFFEEGTVPWFGRCALDSNKQAVWGQKAWTRTPSGGSFGFLHRFVHHGHSQKWLSGGDGGATAVSLIVWIFIWQPKISVPPTLPDVWNCCLFIHYCGRVVLDYKVCPQKWKCRNVRISVIIHLLLAGLFASSSHYLCPLGLKAPECGLTKNTNIFHPYNDWIYNFLCEI